MNAEQAVQATVASRLQAQIDNIYALANPLTDSQLEALDYSVADLWSAFGFQMVSCSECRETIPEVLVSRRQGRSYCASCASKKPGYSTTRHRRHRVTVKCRRGSRK